MKLRNKKKGEIKEVIVGGYPVSGETKMWECSEMDANEETGYKSLGTYTSLAELNEEWEDVPEEPKEYWFISTSGEAHRFEGEDKTYTPGRKQLGNYFETREEAEQAVEKLKAWKRLKDRNLRFNLNYSTGGATIHHKDVIMCWIEAYFDDKWEEENMKAEEDLDLLLGGEE